MAKCTESQEMLMTATRIVATAAICAASGVAQAQFSSTISAVSDYDFRGVSLSARDPALQASADYAFGESGFALGAWTSNIDSGPDVDGDLEVDVYASFDRSFNETFGVSAGVTYYGYPDGDHNVQYAEGYLGFNAGDFELKQWYAHKYIGTDDGALYTEANYLFAVTANLSMTLHAGYSYGDAFEDIELMDYSVGLDYSAGNFLLGMKATGTDASGELKVEDDVFNNEPRLLISISTTLPW
jgi:uncharacterized protein (TIGR02001 family)